MTSPQHETYSQSNDLSSLSAALLSALSGQWLCLNGLSPAISHSWESMVNTLFLLMFQKLPTANSNATDHAQTVYLLAAKLDSLFSGTGNVPRFDSPEKFRWSSKSLHNSNSSSTNVKDCVANTAFTATTILS